jgi:DNA-binding NtrC family response regulator
VIAASNREVEEEVKAGRFRQDLFYRLNAVSIVLPPLRERREDILPLAKSFVRQVSAINPAVALAPEALQLLESYPWPGNIRELENAVVRAAAMCDGTIRVRDLPERIRISDATAAVSSSDETRGMSGAEPQEWLTLAEVEGRYVIRVLEHTRGNKQAAARLLMVDRKTLDRMIKRHRINFGNLAHLPLRRSSILATDSRG